ncbi:MAG: hypothetical protein FJ147_26670 [Deltaproteobacteria bacterium]|nr:hypothetical protein [Deltaproteobacteria bacterium]
MDKRYSFSIDTTRRLMKFRMWGFWEEAEGKEFAKDFNAHVDKVKTLGEGFYVVVDASNYPVQRKEIQDVHQAGMQYAVTSGMKKSANVVGSAVSRLQLRLLSQNADTTKFGWFQTEAEAEQWIFS